MVETGAGGFHQPNWDALAQDLIPAEDETYDLGSDSKKWAYVYAAIAILTSMVIGGVYLGATTEGYFLINATTQINGSLFVVDGINATNINASYFTGLYNWRINSTGSSPLYLNFNTSDLTFNETHLNLTITDLQQASNETALINSVNASFLLENTTLWNRLNSINLTILDSNASWLSTYNASYKNRLDSLNSTFINNLTINFNRLNSINSSFLLENTTLWNRLNSINSSFLLENTTLWNRLNSINTTIIDSNSSWLSTYNASYFSRIGVLNATIIDSNSSWLSTYNVTYLAINLTSNLQNQLNDTSMQFHNLTLSADLNMKIQNITSVDCIHFESGGKICSG